MDAESEWYELKSATALLQWPAGERIDVSTGRLQED
jgi:hypothetical protein